MSKNIKASAPATATNTAETFPQYLARVGQDYDDSANTPPDRNTPYPKSHKCYDESPTARDYREAAARIAELEAALDGLAVAANWALGLVPAGPRRNQGEMRLGRAYSLLGETKRFRHLHY